MSLISDALKKAQKERDKLNTHDETSNKDYIEKDSRKFFIKSLIYIFIFVSIFAAMFFIFNKSLPTLNSSKIKQKKTGEKLNIADKRTKETGFKTAKTKESGKENSNYLNKKNSFKTPKTSQESIINKKSVKKTDSSKENQQLKTENNKQSSIDEPVEKETKKLEETSDLKIDIVEEKKSYKTADMLIKEARINFKNENYEQALKNYTDALGFRPNDKKILFNIGTIYLIRHNYMKAYSYFDKALEQDPYDQSSLFNAGIALFKMRKIQEAKTLWYNLLKINPSFKDIHYYIGMSEDISGNYSEARKHYILYIAAGKNRQLKEWVSNRLKQIK